MSTRDLAALKISVAGPGLVMAMADLVHVCSGVWRIRKLSQIWAVARASATETDLVVVEGREANVS
jgi:hypothetical protein